MAHPDQLIDVFLEQGEYFVGDANYRICTLLGSCVSITLWHRASQTGAMSHFVLPECVGNAERDAHYGDAALRLMVDAFAQRAIVLAECEAKLFGGGEMFPELQHEGASIGRKNGRFARALLQRYGIGLVSEDLFGQVYRQIVFDIGTGDVWVRQCDTARSRRTDGEAA